MARLSDVDGDSRLYERVPATLLAFGTGASERTYTLGWMWYVSKVTEPLSLIADDHWIEATGIVTPPDTNSPRDPGNTTLQAFGEARLKALLPTDQNA